MRGRRATRVLCGLVTLALTVAACSSSSPKKSTPQPTKLPIAACKGEHTGTGPRAVMICRDGYGIPSIWAAATPGMWYGTGWAQAEDRLAQMELVRRNARGTLAELFGAFDPSTIDQDKQILAYYYTDAELRQQYDSLPQWIRDALTDFVAGVNAYVDHAYATPASRDKLVPLEFFAIGKLRNIAVYRPKPFTVLDIVANGNFLAREFGGGGGDELSNLQFLQFLQKKYGATEGYAIFNDARWVDDPNAPTTVPDGRPTYGNGGSTTNTVPAAPAELLAVHGRNDPPADVVTAAAAARARHFQLLESIGTRYHVPWRDGSNAWVVAPKKTTDGNTFLWGGPQEGFDSPNIDWEVYQHGPGFDVGGMTIALDPFVLIGRNAFVAFTTTSEETVDQQVYQEQADFSKEPPTYLYKGRTLTMTALHHVIKVPGKPDQKWTSYRTVHGPVIQFDPKEKVAFSVQYASFGKEWQSLEGFAMQSTAKNLDEYRNAISKIVTLHNFFYADREGNIAYFGAGLVPKLNPCPDLKTEQACDPRLPHAGDGSQEWQGMVPFSDMPHSVNPDQGYLANWNTKPSSAHFLQQNSGDEYWGTIYRSEPIVKALQSKPKLSPQDLTAIEANIGTIDDDNTRPAAPYFLPKLLDAYARNPALHTAQADRAIAVLRQWNGSDTIGSAGMSIFVEWMHTLQQRVFGVKGTVPFAGTAANQDFTSKGTYNLLWHVLGGTKGIVPCDTLCSNEQWLGPKPDATLVGALRDALVALAGKAELPGTHGAHGYGTTDVTKWKWVPNLDKDWSDLDPVANAAASLGLLKKPKLGVSPTQNRSTWMQAMVLTPTQISGTSVFAPGESGFIAKNGTFDPHFADQVPLFNAFRYKPMPDADG